MGPSTQQEVVNPPADSLTEQLRENQKKNPQSRNRRRQISNQKELQEWISHQDL